MASIPWQWFILYVAVALISVLISPCSTKDDLRLVISNNKESECETSSPRVMIEKFPNFSGINETAHKAALDVLGNTELLQSLKVRSSKARMLLDEIYDDVTNSFACSLEAFCESDSKGTRFELIKEVQLLHKKIKSLLVIIPQLQNGYDIVSPYYSRLESETATASNSLKIGLFRRIYLDHEPALVAGVCYAFGWDRKQAWWRPWEENEAMKELSHMVSSTYTREFRPLRPLFVTMSELGLNLDRLIVDLPQRKHSWWDEWYFWRSDWWSKEGIDNRAVEEEWIQNWVRRWYLVNIIQDLVREGSGVLETLPSCGWGIKLTCEA